MEIKNTQVLQLLPLHQQDQSPNNLSVSQISNLTTSGDLSILTNEELNHKSQQNCISDLILAQIVCDSKTNGVISDLNSDEPGSQKQLFQNEHFQQKQRVENNKLLGLQELISLPLLSDKNLSIFSLNRSPSIKINSVGQMSQQFDLDFQSNDNELPLSSMKRYQDIFHLPEQSQNSDENHQHSPQKQNYSSRMFYIQRKESQSLQSEQDMVQCLQCKIMMEKLQQINKQKDQLLKQVENYRQAQKIVQKNKKQGCLSSTNSNDDCSSNMSNQNNDNLTISQICVQQVNELTKILVQLFKSDQKIDVYFSQEERQVFLNFDAEFIKLKKILQIQHKNTTKDRFYDAIHQKYRKLIEKLKWEHRQHITKLQQDFRSTMSVLVLKGGQCCNKLNLSRTNDSKMEVSRVRVKKIKTLSQKQQIPEFQVEEHNKQIVQLLQINLQKQKNKVKYYERYHRKVIQKFNAEILELTKQRNAYRTAANRYVKQFDSVMSKIVKSSTNFSGTTSCFFKTVSQRIFEISNCIPFEDNDQQNLFVPQNQVEVFDMMERVRRFYLKIQQYTMRKQRQSFSLKKYFLLLLKDLIDSQKLAIRSVKESINKNKQLGLEFVKDFVINLRNRRHKTGQKRYGSPKKAVKNKILTLIKTQSFSFRNQNSQMKIQQ